MLYDEEWSDHRRKNRRVAVQKTIRRASIEELKKLGEQCFPVVSDPWYARYNKFLTKNPSAKFYLAETPERAKVIYCRDTEQGFWFLPGSGMGIIQPKGLKAIKDIVDEL